MSCAALAHARGAARGRCRLLPPRGAARPTRSSSTATPSRESEAGNKTTRSHPRSVYSAPGGGVVERTDQQNVRSALAISSARSGRGEPRCCTTSRRESASSNARTANSASAADWTRTANPYPDRSQSITASTESQKGSRASRKPGMDSAPPLPESLLPPPMELWARRANERGSDKRVVSPPPSLRRTRVPNSTVSDQVTPSPPPPPEGHLPLSRL